MVDVIVAGSGPAAAVATLVLARAGVRALMVTPEMAPCDGRGVALVTTVAVSALERIGFTPPAATGRRLEGWCLGLPHASLHRVSVDEHHGPIAVSRRDMQTWLVDIATRAGARIEAGWHVRAPLVDRATGSVRGVVIGRRRPPETVRMPAHVVIAADRSRSVLARRLGVFVPPDRRRWLYEATVAGITGLTDHVEIHLASRSYCRVTPQGADVADIRCVSESREMPTRVDLPGRLSRHRLLASRVSGARVVAGPWTMRLDDACARTIDVPGLLLTGDGRDDWGEDDDLAVAVADGHAAARAAIDILEAGSGAGAIVRREPAIDEPMDAHRRSSRRRHWMLRHAWSVHAAGVSSRIMPRLATRLLLHEVFT